MYQGKHGNNHRGRAPRRPRMSRTVMVALALVLVLGLAIGGTIAYLVTNTGSIANTFTPAKVTTSVEEEFKNNVKNNVTIKNTGDTDAYIRAMVVVTWQDKDGNVYATAPAADTDYTVTWTMADWVKSDDGYYYYTKKVAPANLTDVLLTGCQPVEAAPAEGYHLVVEILAEGIQAEPASAVGEAWGVKIANGTVTAYTAN